MSSLNRSIVMVDWSRSNEPTPGTRNQFLWHQMILSLLYDEVLAQDEIFVCSTRMARWFHDSETFRLLQELFESGGIRVLKRPWQKYPQGLQERVQQRPIAARREHLERFSVDNDGEPLRFDKQQAFHDRLEDLLVGHKSYHRDAGSNKIPGKDLMQEFGQLLETVLIDERYNRWLSRKFKNITPEIAKDFVRFIHDPIRAIDHLTRARPNQPPRFTQLPGRPVFSTALAVQVAATYEKQAKELQSLIETVFARPFCQEEGADGRYGRLLQDLPLPLEGQETRNEVVDPVKVEVAVRVPLRLPWPRPNFPKIIQAVRDSSNGRKLRAAMSQIGDDATFATVTTAWQAVAADLASHVSSAKQIELRMLVHPAARGILWGTMADLMLRPPHSGENLTSRLAAPALAATLDAGGSLLAKLRQADLERQQISRQLEKAVDFSCVQHPTVKLDQNER